MSGQNKLPHTTSSLSRWDLAPGADISDEAIAEILDHPRFGDAMRHVARRALALMDAHPAHHRAFDDIGNFVLGMLALYLDATSGLTHRKLRELCGGAGVLSTGRATAILLRLRMIGYVRPQDDSQTRVRRYAPTDTMLAMFKARFRIEFEAIEKFEPEVGKLLAHFDEPETFRMVCAGCGAFMYEAAKGRRPEYDVLTAVGGKRSGMVMIFHLFLALDDGGAFPRPGEMNVNVAALAARLGTSRAHVLSLLRDFERAGYFTRGHPDRIEPVLANVFAHYYATAFGGSLCIAARICRELDRAGKYEWRAKAPPAALVPNPKRREWRHSPDRRRQSRRHRPDLPPM
jgi:hypothetical protein